MSIPKSGTGVDIVRDTPAYEAGKQAAATGGALTVEEAVAQWGPCLLLYLHRRGLSIVGGQLDAAWPTVVSFCDGYAESLVRRWGQPTKRAETPFSVDCALPTGRGNL